MCSSDLAAYYGPPVLWWTRPFEHRHCTFRVYIERSNKKDVATWSIEREILMETITYLFGEYVKIRPPTPKHAFRRLNKGDHVRYFNEQSEKCFGRVEQINGDSTCHILQLQQPSTRHKVMKCYCDALSVPQGVKLVHKSKIFARFSIIHGFWNLFEPLQISKV